MKYLVTVLSLLLFTNVLVADEWEEERDEWCHNLEDHYLITRLGLALFNDATGHAPTSTSETSYDAGWFGSLGWGYKINDCIAVEGEVSRQKADVDSIIINGTGFSNISGRQKVWSFMVNAIYDTAARIGCFQPYFGLGFGLTHFNLKITGTGANDIDDTQTAFAYQTISGLCYPWNSCADLCLEYRYLSSGDPRFRNSNGGFKTKFNSHNFTGAVRYHF